ncbi:MAG: hypothetical protein ACLQVJ_06910 [Syntrophobacteraceae bacterium]
MKSVITFASSRLRVGTFRSRELKLVSHRSLFTAKPEIGAIADMPKLFRAVTAKLEEGEITPSEIKTLIDLAEGIRKSLEVVELEQRISALEERAKPRSS